jgi:hypothetical protein
MAKAMEQLEARFLDKLDFRQTIQTMQQTINELAKENAELKKQQRSYVLLVKVSQSIEFFEILLKNIIQPYCNEKVNFLL